MNLEVALLGISFVGMLTAVFFSWWRPTVMRNTLREDYERLRKELECANEGLDDAKNRLSAAEKRIEQLVRENIRQQAIILWQQLQFEKHGIAIDPMPEYLKETGAFAGINFQFTDSGVHIDGGTVTAKDIVGGNVVKRDEVTKEK